MIRRNQPAHVHASPTPATRGISEARRRAADSDLDAYERQRWAIRNARTDDTAAWRTPRGPRRRRRSIGRTLGLVLFLVVIAIAVGAVLVGMRAAAFNDKVSTSPFLSAALFGPLNGSDRVNIVMVGYGGGDHDGAYLADSINILSIDPATDTTTTIPIPRDLWIEGVSRFGPDEGSKVNAAFAIGEQEGGIAAAGESIASVLTEVTGQQIDHWMAIDFNGFSEMVDAVGGVTINNPTEFSYTMNEQLFRSGNFNGGTFPAGELHLDGAQALAYVRARYTNVTSESSDYARSARQARIIGGLRSSLGSGGIGAIGPGLGMMDALEGRLQTDLSAIDLFLLSGHMTSDRRIELTEDVVLVATTNTIGQYILIPIDWSGPGTYGSVHQYLADELAKPIASPTPTASDDPAARAP
jgi:polyisoprenyl-teichoic acid--peptidoglycan teichoic acid transferase